MTATRMHGMSGALVLLMRAAGIKPNFKLVLAALLAHSSFTDATNAHPSLSTLSVETGLSVSTCRRALHEAVRLGIILPTPGTESGGDPTRGVCYDFDLARLAGLPLSLCDRGKARQPLSADAYDPCQNAAATPGKSSRAYMEEQNPGTEEEQTSLSSTIKSTTAEACYVLNDGERLINAFNERWKKEHGRLYHATAKDRQKAAVLVAQEPNAADCIDAYFAHADAYFRDNGHPFAFFVSQFEKFLAVVKEADRSRSDAEASDLRMQIRLLRLEVYTLPAAERPNTIDEMREYVRYHKANGDPAAWPSHLLQFREGKRA